MRAYSRNVRRYKTIKSLKKKVNKGNRKKTKTLKRGGGLKFLFCNKKRKSKSKRSKKYSRSLKRKQSGGFSTTPATISCSDDSTQTSNKAIFDSSFNHDHSQNNGNNTAPPTCNYVGQNLEGTKAFSCY